MVMLIPSLLIQVFTGLRMSMIYQPISLWFSFEGPISTLISLKLLLLLATVGLAIHARFFIIPHLRKETIGLLGGHIIAVTVIALLFLVVGLSFRLGVIG